VPAEAILYQRVSTDEQTPGAGRPTRPGLRLRPRGGAGGHGRLWTRACQAGRPLRIGPPSALLSTRSRPVMFWPLPSSTG
jgi:hypothetical protein